MIDHGEARSVGRDAHIERLAVEERVADEQPLAQRLRLEAAERPAAERQAVGEEGEGLARPRRDALACRMDAALPAAAHGALLQPTVISARAVRPAKARLPA